MKAIYQLLIITFTLFISTTAICANKDVIFKGQSKSLVKWDTISPSTWNSFERWKKHNFIKNSTPNWYQFKRESLLKERVGRVLQCFGNCYVENGEGSSSALFRTSIYETEEFATSEDSYAWIFLMDGSLVRVSPNSSITFKEINIGQKKNFYQARLNYGNILWLSRQSVQLSEINRRETDVLFLPLEFYEANTKKEKLKLTEDNLFAAFEETTFEKEKYVRLNKLIANNNEYLEGKATELFLVTPNTTIYSTNPSLNVITLVGGKSYIKSLSSKFLGLKEEVSTRVEIQFRGYENYQKELIDSSGWVEVDRTGRTLSVADENIASVLRVSEIPSKRIPSIYIARELLIKKYSYFSFRTDHKGFELAKNYGYRLWQNYKDTDKSELDMRVTFLEEYTRRLETTNLNSIEKLKKQNLSTDDNFANQSYSVGFFSRAILSYLKRKDASDSADEDYKKLNSVTKDLWKRMHAIR